MESLSDLPKIDEATEVIDAVDLYESKYIEDDTEII